MAFLISEDVTWIQSLTVGFRWPSLRARVTLCGMWGAEGRPRQTPVYSTSPLLPHADLGGTRLWTRSTMGLEVQWVCFMSSLRQHITSLKPPVPQSWAPVQVDWKPVWTEWKPETSPVRNRRLTPDFFPPHLTRRIFFVLLLVYCHTLLMIGTAKVRNYLLKYIIKFIFINFFS